MRYFPGGHAAKLAADGQFAAEPEHRALVRKRGPDLWEDSVASVLEAICSSANTPELDTTARDAARRNLSALIQPYLGRSSKSAK